MMNKNMGQSSNSSLSTAVLATCPPWWIAFTTLSLASIRFTAFRYSANSFVRYRLYRALVRLGGAHQQQYLLRLVLCIVLLFIANSNSLLAQSTNKGQLFFNWGWNRAAFTNSTLRMKGYDYNLTLFKLKASDRPTELSYYNYLKIDRITIPQTNARLGYFFKKNKAIVLGVDHMKYVINQNQAAKVVGEITRVGARQGTYNSIIPITEDFLTFEHTDGLNYINLGIEQYGTLWNAKSGKHQVEYITGANAGVLVPKTNVKFLDYERTDRFHLSGVGVGAKAGLQYVWLKHILVRVEGSTGYIYMPNIILHKSGVAGKGNQNFAYLQGNVQFGYRFSLSSQRAK